MPGIDYTLGMKTSGFDSGVSAALGKLASIGTKVAAITGVAGAGIGAIVAKSIGKAAEMEGLETAFIPLLGSVKAAQDRMAELASFAANTPFDLPGVVAASKTLETLTRGSLSTGKGLTQVGDVASIAGVPFEEMAVTIGRLYDGLDSGRPVGEALARLQELGSISGDTRAKIEALQAEGKKGAEVWSVAEAAFSKFNGAMNLQSGTWNGKMSNLSDTISNLMAKFGEPIMDALKPYLDAAIAKVESFQSAAIAAGQAIGNALQLGMAAFQEGRLFEVAGQVLKVGFLDAVNTLAKGIQAAVMGIGAGIEQSGLANMLTSLFAGIGDMLSSKLKSASADFMQGIGLFGHARDLRAGAAADDMRAGNYFTQAKAGMSMLDPGAAVSAMVTEFKDSFANLPDLLDATGAKKDLDASMLALTARAQANADAAASKQAAIVAGITQKTAAVPSGVAAAAAERTGGGGPARELDRLEQIGGYVGRGARGMAEKAADKTAQWTQRTAEGITKLVEMTRGNQLQPVGGSLF